MEGKAKQNHVAALPWRLNEGLGEYEDDRRKHMLKVSAARLGGQPVAVIQEPWEIGFTILLPRELASGEAFQMDMDLAGDFMLLPKDAEYDYVGSYGLEQLVENVFYPRMSTSWYPRHGYLSRAKYRLEFRHRKDHLVVSTGRQVSSEVTPDGHRKSVWEIDEPVPAASFGVGGLNRTSQFVPEQKVTVEFSGLPAR